MIMRRSLLIVGMAIGGILALAFCALLVVLGSDSGTRWSLQLTQRLMPELSTEQISGTWLGGLHTDTLRWRNADVDIVISDLNLRIQWPALLHGQLKLLPLNAKQFDLHLIGPSNDNPVQLPLLLLPFSLAAPELTLRQLTIIDGDSTVALSNLHTAARWSGTTLELLQTQLSWDDLQLSADGTLNFRGDYPVKLRGNLLVPQLPEPIAITSKGDLRRLQLNAVTKKPLPANADIVLATLDKHLPLQAHITLTEANTVLEPTLPLLTRSGTLDIDGDLNRIGGNLSLALNEPHYGDSTIAATLEWTPGQLIANSKLTVAGGDLHSDCKLMLTESIAWSCAAVANTLPLTPWLPQINGTLSGPIQLDGSWRAQQLGLTLDMPALSGQLGTDIIAGQLKLQTDNGKLWQLTRFALIAGPNQLQAKGELGNHNQLQLDIKAPDLSHLGAELAGALTAMITVDGNWPEPNIRAQLRGDHLRYLNSSIQQLNTVLAIPRLGLDDGRAHIDLQQLVVDGHTPFDAALISSGNRSQQRSALTLRHQKNHLDIGCKTQSTANYQDWQLTCDETQATLQTAQHLSQWRANSALRGSWKVAAQQFELAPFCVSADEAALCLDSPLRINQQQLQTLSAHGRALPVSWIEPWLPETLKLDNDARANLQINLKSATPLQLNASLKIPHTQWSWQLAGKQQRADVNDIDAALQLDEHNAQFDGGAHSPTIGNLATHLTIHEPRGARNIDGAIELQHIELAGLAWLVNGLDSISGQVNGTILLGGSLATPALRGQLLLQDGTANWAPLGAPFRNVHMSLDFDNNSAKLGGWFALGQGGGDIDGAISWSGTGEDWHARLGVIAGGISAAPLPQSTIVFSPHIDLTAAPAELHASGYVDIANAEFFLKELPPETIDVSQDAHIVGQQIPANTWKVWADIGLNLGDQFHFQGLGADVNLTGRLRLQQEPGDLPHLTGEVRIPKGRYRAYGQRLSVRRGSFIFYGPWDNPDLNLEAVRDMPPGVTDIVGLRIIGSLKTPEAILFSEPSLPDSDIAYYLLTGRKPSNNSTANQFSASGALLSLGLSGSEDRASKLAEKFGIKDLQLGTTQGANGSEAELSGQLSQDLYVRYGRGLGQRSNSITFQYKLTPKLMIETTSGIEDALDLLYSFNVK